jgi:hypothetical protein
MPTPKRPRREPTHEWGQIQQRILWPEQEWYEQIRPMLLFGQTAGERAKETNAAQRTLARKADEFERYGMLSLFAREKPGEKPEAERERAGSLPKEVRQLIVDLYAQLPTMSWREMAEICYIRTGRRPSHHSVKQVMATGPPSQRSARRSQPWELIPDPAERRLAVIRLHADIRKIDALYFEVIGCLWRDHVGVALLRNGTADPYPCRGKTPDPSMGDVVGPLMSI